MCWWNESTRAVSARIGRAHHCVCGWSGLSPPESLETFPRWPSVRPRATSFNTQPSHPHLSLYICCSSLCCRLFPPQKKKEKKNLKKGWGSLPPPKKRIRSLSISCPGSFSFLCASPLFISTRTSIHTHLTLSLSSSSSSFPLELDADGRAFLLRL